MKKMLKEKITLSLSRLEMQKLKELAAKDNRSRSSYIGTLILREHKRQKDRRGYYY
jgi:hypothetical protein